MFREQPQKVKESFLPNLKKYSKYCILTTRPNEISNQNIAVLITYIKHVAQAGKIHGTANCDVK